MLTNCIISLINQFIRPIFIESTKQQWRIEVCQESLRTRERWRKDRDGENVKDTEKKKKRTQYESEEEMYIPFQKSPGPNV